MLLKLYSAWRTAGLGYYSNALFAGLVQSECAASGTSEESRTGSFNSAHLLSKLYASRIRGDSKLRDERGGPRKGDYAVKFRALISWWEEKSGWEKRGVAKMRKRGLDQHSRMP